jgi:hypothetical protein
MLGSNEPDQLYGHLLKIAPTVHRPQTRYGQSRMNLFGWVRADDINVHR